MDKEQAQELIRKTFEAVFDKEQFVIFIKNLLNRIKESTFIYRGNFIPDAFEQYISTLERIGKYTDGENEIDLLIVKLKKETSLERARTMQRNFIAWYLKGSRGGIYKNAALVAFVSPNEYDWRFSLVKVDYIFNKNGKVIEEKSPVRRWSFLVGKNEKSHTAQSRLVPILEDDEHNPTLPELENAFNIEKVTKEFFEKYRDLFIRIKEELDKIVENNPKIKADFKGKGVDTVNFTKKLLGQIVFLYFLQKKGWFGVRRDAEWGTGPKDFLRQLFEKRYGDYKNFFNDILEPLFYEALAREHDDNFYSRFNCKIPFLNGGLFEPIGGYDWVHTDIVLPDELFSNTRRTPEGDIGNGILDVFDRFNFTVKEDEPLEKEVAIDPELLGKAYEKFNAIRPDNYEEYKKALKSGKKGEENKFNKKFGVYYTPREIVHYMCQQSLINYLSACLAQADLATELSDSHSSSISRHSRESGNPVVSKEDIETLIKFGEQISENEETALIKEQNIKEGIQKTSDYKLKLPENIRQNAKLIDDKLADIKVCDPAVGSGAFPVGMMNEIVKARNVLTTYISYISSPLTGEDLPRGIKLHSKHSPIPQGKGEGEKESGNTYQFKRHCIEHSLYGVDIDPGAVEIAKLRLWLSLVVDEEDIKNIKPLPNLDYKIMQGNSLISEFMGINFDVDKKQNSEKSMFKYETDELIKQFQQRKDEFLNESNASQKSKLKKEIDDLLVKIFETKLRTQKTNYFNRLKDIEDKYSVVQNEKQRHELIKQDKDKLNKKFDFDLESAEKQLKEFTSGRKIKLFFLWNLYFSEVFHEKKGFDVVIANPPYLKERDNKKVFEIVNNSDLGKKYHQGKMDYWYYFLHKAINIIKKEGVISYITSRYWLNSSGAKKLIHRVREELSFIDFVDIGKLKVFDEVAGQHMVAVYQKKKEYPCLNYKKLINDLSDISKNEDTENIQIKVLSNRDIFSDNGEILLEKPFYDTANIINLGAITEISQGVVQNPDKVSIKAANKYDLNASEGVFVLEKGEFNKLNLSEKEMLFVKKFYDERNFSRYFIANNSFKYLLYITKNNCDDINRLPGIKKHLSSYKEIMNERRETKKGTILWFQLHWPRNQKYFKNRRIIIPSMFRGCSATYIEEEAYFGLSTNIIISSTKKYDLKYILAIINSNFAHSWFYKNGKKRGAGVDIGVEKLRQFPIKDIQFQDQKSFIDLVDRILSITKDENYLQNPQKQAKVKEYEKQIDQMVYKLYNLTKEEIKIVEGMNNNPHNSKSF